MAQPMRRILITLPEDLIMRLEEVTKEFNYSKSVQIQTVLRKHLETEYDIPKERRMKGHDAYRT
jgi:metal-responsive CopG/Arc/MetJ family transcriptional regulator